MMMNFDDARVSPTGHRTENQPHIGGRTKQSYDSNRWVEQATQTAKLEAQHWQCKLLCQITMMDLPDAGLHNNQPLRVRERERETKIDGKVPGPQMDSTPM